MRYIFALIAVTFFTAAAYSQSNTTKTKPSEKVATEHKVVSPTAVEVTQNAVPAESLVLKETEFDFGKIPQGKPVTHIFEYTNTGKTALNLDNVQASCGCTTPVWKKEAVAPGETAQITVGYNAAAEGTFAKPVTITYNGNLTKQIIIKGEVYKTPETSAPQNSGINNLKNQQ